VSNAKSYDIKTHMQSRIKNFRTMIYVNKYLQSFTKDFKRKFVNSYKMFPSRQIFLMRNDC